MTVRRVPLTYDTITAAINAADPGDTILVACGVYTGSVTVDVPRLRIEGESPSCTILQGPGAVGFTVTAPLVTITGFTVRDFDVGIDLTLPECTVRNNRILNCGVNGISLHEQRSLILNNEIENCPIGVALFANSNYLVGNRIRNASERGIDAPGFDNVLIVQNRLDACNRGITVTGAGNWINNNVVFNATGYGIDVDGQNHQLYGNICTGSGLSGLLLAGTGHVVVLNQFSNSRGDIFSDGIDCHASDCIFYGNEMVRNRASGFRGALGSDRNVLLTNKVQNNDTGILSLQNDSVRVLSNQVRANRDVGIETGTHTTNSIVENNTVTANRGNGVSVLEQGTEDNAVRRNGLCGNKPFDIDIALPAFAQGNTFDLNTCNRSNPSNLCSRGC